MQKNRKEIHPLSFEDVEKKITWEYAKNKAIAHENAVSNTNQEQHRFIPILHASLRASFEKVAKTIGLDGVSEDIMKYVSYDTTFSRFKPLVTCGNLSTLFLNPNSPLYSTAINTFFNVKEYSHLYFFIHSMDLASGLSLYKHQVISCDTLPNKLEKNTIYIQLTNQQLTCTVLCPLGNQLSKNYEINNFELAGHKIQLSQQDFYMCTLHSKAHLLLKDIYYDQGLGSFNLFFEGLEKVKGFKSHVIKTIRACNQELKRINGLSMMLLTSEHLSQTCGNHYCGFETLPDYRPEHKHHKKILKEIEYVYESELKRLEKEYKNAINEAKIKFNIEENDAPKEALIIQKPIPTRQINPPSLKLNDLIIEKPTLEYQMNSPSITLPSGVTAREKKEPILIGKHGLFTTIEPSMDEQSAINAILNMPIEKFLEGTQENKCSRLLK